MEPAFRVLLAWLLFAATHFGLAALPIRGALVRRLGRWGYLGAYTVVAAVGFAFAVATTAAERLEGAPGFGLASSGGLAQVLAAVVVLGFVLMMAALAEYPRMPMAPGREQVKDPYGLSRVTRHPFFVGVTLFAGAHALLASRLAGAVAMAALALIAAFGAWLQDRKLLVLRGEPYRRYLAATSALPFAAIAAGRQRLVLNELPFAGFAVGCGLAWLLRRVHADIFAHGGIYAIATVVGGSLVILGGELRRDRRGRSAARVEA